jgi:hypothetical protein
MLSATSIRRADSRARSTIRRSTGFISESLISLPGFAPIQGKIFFCNLIQGGLSVTHSPPFNIFGMPPLGKDLKRIFMLGSISGFLRFFIGASLN